MNRKTFDLFASVIGLLLAVVLIVAGILLQWGGNFANGQVKDQLVAQKITFPEAGSQSLTSLPAADRAAMEKYAGQTMTTGDQAYTWANHYIKVHMGYIANGKTYDEVSGDFMAKNGQLQADPNNKALAATVATLGQQRQSLFMGSTLMGLLGFTYAFATIAKIALIASWASFIAGALLLVPVIAGFAQVRKAELQV